MSPCEGDVSVSLNPGVGEADPTQLLAVTGPSVLNCGSIGGLDISKALAGLFPAKSSNTQTTNLIKSGSTLAFASFGGATFTPPRPIFPSLLASSPTDLTALNVSVPVLVQSPAGHTAGVASLVMNSFNQPYTPPGMSTTFPNAMQFVATTQGFDASCGVNLLGALLFPSLEFRMSLNPLSVMQIQLTAPADQLISALSTSSSGSGGSVGAALTGLLQEAAPIIENAGSSPSFASQVASAVASDFTITITMDLTAQVGLSAGDATSRSTGETISGKPTGN